MLSKSFLIGIVQCVDVVLDWKVGYVANINPDGKFPRRVIGVNGKWPLPPIDVTLGDTLTVNIENTLDVPTSFHSHGLYFFNANYMDGAPGITECGIPPGGKQTYVIPIEQTGTYWAHSHTRGQYVDGFQTSFIIHAPNEKITQRYDEEYILSFTDWYHEQHSVLLDHFLSIFNPQGAEPIPDSAIINHGQKTELVFVPGKTYRLRLISMTAIGLFNFYIDGHKFKVIEVDGELVEPYETDVLYMSAAQRYSILVTAKADTKFNYYAHGKLDQAMLDTPCPNPNATVSIIYDKDAPFFLKKEESDYPSPFENFDQLVLKPQKVEPVVKPDASYLLNVDFVQYEDAFNHGTFNRTVFEFPPVPSIFTALTMGDKAMSPVVYGPRTLSVVLNYMDMVEVVINNLDPGHHPFHLHGHKFQIIQMGKGKYDANVHSEISNKVINPIRRDTIIIPGEGFAVIRFRADNPGAWIFHCHIEWHPGLGNLFIVAPNMMQKNLKVPKDHLDNCEALKMKVSGNAAGFFDDITFTGISPPPAIYPEYIQFKGIVALVGTIMSAMIGLYAVLWYSSFDNPNNKPSIVEVQ